MATNQQSDITIKVYKRGNLAGKIALYFCTDKAKKVYEKIVWVPEKRIKDDNNRYLLAYDVAALPKAETFCSNNQLHYEIIEIHA